MQGWLLLGAVTENLFRSSPLISWLSGVEGKLIKGEVVKELRS